MEQFVSAARTIFSCAVITSLAIGCRAPTRRDASSFYSTPSQNASTGQTLTAATSVQPVAYAVVQEDESLVAESKQLDFEDPAKASEESTYRDAGSSTAPGEEDLARLVETTESVNENEVTAAELPTTEIQALQVPTFSPEQYVAQALASHPKIAALNHRIASLRNQVVVARSLPDPLLQETVWPFNGNALETAGGRASSQIGLSQQVPWPEKLRTKAAIACREVQVAEAELAKFQVELAESVRLACVRVAFSEAALDVLAEFESLANQLLEVSEAKYASAVKGSGQQDVLRAQSEVDRIADRRVSLRRQKQVAQVELATLLSQPDIPVPRVELDLANQSLIARLDELVALAASCNPSLTGLIAEIARDREKRRLACLQRYPDFQLGANWLIISERDALSPVATGNDNFGFTVGMTLPVWKDRVQAGIAAAGHQVESTSSLLQSERVSIAGRLRQLVVEFDALLEQTEILQDRIIPRTEDALEIALVDYSGNRTDFPAVVDLYEERLMLELQRLALEQRQQETLIRIKATVGCVNQVSAL